MLQNQLAESILSLYPDAVVKKINKDNFLDIHLPQLNEKKGTHLFFNTAGGKIKLGFYCREEDFVERILSSSSEIEKYSQGIRLKENPVFNDFEEAFRAAVSLITLILGEKENGIQDQIKFNDAVKAYLKGDLDLVTEYIDQGSPMLQFNESHLITVELISYVSAFEKLDSRIENLVNKGTNLEETTSGDDCGYTAIHFAAWDNKSDILELLLKKGANPNAIGSEDGISALYLASVNGHFESVKILLENSADPNIKLKGIGLEALEKYFGEEGGTALRGALVNFQFDIAFLLLDHGAELAELLEPCIGKELPTTDFIELLGILGEKLRIDFEVDKYDVLKKRVLAIQSSENPILDRLSEEKNDENEEKLNDSDEEEEEDEEKGFPIITFRKPSEELGAIVNEYFKKWQKPSYTYAWRMGITGYIPEFVEELVSDDVCPVFTDEQINAIYNKIYDDKVIPIMDYAPSELFFHTKRVWWIVPFCIWKDDVASMVFVDKNGFYALLDNEDEVEIQMIFPWDKVDQLDFEYAVDGDPNVCRLTLYDENGGYLTFDEFVSDSFGVEGDHGSYLRVIEGIWEARRETIEASRGESFWIEGHGGETFEVYGNPSELYKSDEEKKAEINLKILSLRDFNSFVSFVTANKEKTDLLVIYQGLNENLQKD